MADTITDQLGRQVVVPDQPKRVVSLAPSITEIIFALGQEANLKGVTRFSDYPPQARKFPKVGSYVHLDVEKIVALKPDLCIAVKDGNPVTIIEKLESMNIPVYAVDPRNLSGTMDAMIEMGRLLNAREKAALAVADMKKRIDHITSLTETAEHTPGVFFQIGITPIVAVGTNTFINELIVLAGGNNLTKGPVPYPRLSKEQVLWLSPEIMIITSMARGEVFEKVKREWQQWNRIPAVANDAVYLVDSDLFDRAAPRLVDGLEVLARLIHPELFVQESK